MRILIADDEPDVLDVLAEFVEEVGHEPLRAANGLAAWEIFDREPVHLIVTDWLMPGLDGLELVRRVREAKRRRYTYVILLTALNGRDDYRTGMEAGADDFLTKPVALDELGIRLRVGERVIGLRENVKVLEGLLAICMYCKDVGAERSTWTRIETYIEDHSDASFSHSICPTCFETKVKPQLP